MYLGRFAAVAAAVAADIAIQIHSGHNFLVEQISMIKQVYSESTQSSRVTNTCQCKYGHTLVKFFDKCCMVKEEALLAHLDVNLCDRAVTISESESVRKTVNSSDINAILFLCVHCRASYKS